MPIPLPNIAMLGPVACDVVFSTTGGGHCCDPSALAVRGSRAVAPSASATRQPRGGFILERLLGSETLQPPIQTSQLPAGAAWRYRHCTAAVSSRRLPMNQLKSSMTKFAAVTCVLGLAACGQPPAPMAPQSGQMSQSHLDQHGSTIGRTSAPTGEPTESGAAQPSPDLLGSTRNTTSGTQASAPI